MLTKQPDADCEYSCQGRSLVVPLSLLRVYSASVMDQYKITTECYFFFLPFLVTAKFLFQLAKTDTNVGLL